MAALDLFAIPGFADPFSSLSHLAGAGVFAALSIPLVRKGVRTGQTPWRVASLAIFAAAAVFLLAMSGVYHLLPRGGAARDVMQRLDHAAIFILIAGTFTPIHTILFRGPWRWCMLAFIWTIAALGVTLKSIFFTSTTQLMGLALYLGMGWVGLISLVAISRRYGFRILIPMVLGGLAYTAGAVIEGAQARPLVPGVIRAHEVFHVAVLAGLALHWKFVWSIAGICAVTTRARKALSAGQLLSATASAEAPAGSARRTHRIMPPVAIAKFGVGTPSP